MKLFARLISYLFHPVLFFLVMPFFIVYRQTASGLYAMKWMLFSSVFIFMGVMIIIFETVKGDFSDFDVSKREQRMKFYTILFVLGVLYLSVALFFKGIFFPLSFISVGIALGLIIFAFVSERIKASIHVGTACAFVVSMYILYGGTAFISALWIVPLVGWARWYLKKHTMMEMLIGGILGILITLLTYFLGANILLQ